MHDVRGGASRLLLSNILDDTGRPFLHEGRPSALTRLVCGPKTWNPNKEPHARHQKTRNPHFLEDFPRFSLVSGFLSAGSGFSLRAQNMEPKTKNPEQGTRKQGIDVLGHSAHSGTLGTQCSRSGTGLLAASLLCQRSLVP